MKLEFKSDTQESDSHLRRDGLDHVLTGTDLSTTLSDSIGSWNAGQLYIQGRYIAS